MSARIANTLWLWSAVGEHRRFGAALQNPAETQEQILAAVISQNSQSEFGKEHDFAGSTPRTFRTNVPVRGASEYEPWLSRAAEAHNVLTQSKILYFEKTSGSTGQSRLVPYTAPFRAQINRAVSTWMVSLSHSHPAAFYGPSYWSISPPLRGELLHTPSGVRIGAEDSEYLTPLSRILLSRILAVPQSVTQIQDAEEFYFQTLRFLLLAPSLSLISIWSPAFLTVLDEHLRKRWNDLRASIPASRKRKLSGEPGTWKEIWPGLALLSCWTDSWAAHQVPSIRPILGDVPVQGKGLLATEGVTSIPFEGSTVLAVRSHFYEFRDDAGRLFLPVETQKGGVYEVILTTAGGLYRYATADLVEITGFLGQTPCLKFLGRNLTTDLVGEKVTEAQAALCINSVLRQEGSTHARAAFLPSLPDKRYTLLINSPDGPPSDLNALAARAEAIFCENPYYSQARACGELLSVNARFVGDAEWHALGTPRFEPRSTSGSGQSAARIGTQKTRAILDTVTGV